MEPVAQHNFSGRRLAVFGAGYVGAELARTARALGADVRALTRNEVTAAALRNEGVEVCVAQLADDGWHGFFGGEFDFAVSCVGSGGREEASYRSSYLEGTLSILRWCAGRRVGALVYTSSTSVYPQGGGAVVDETSPVSGRGPLASVLVETEHLLLDAAPQGSRRVILRLAGIYGPGRHHLLDALRGGVRVFDGVEEHHLNLIHRDDIVGAILTVLGRTPAKVGIYNVADFGRATRGEVLRWLSARLGQPEPRFTGVAGPGGRGPVPDRIIASAAIARGLGWRPKYPSFREGYAALLDSPADRGVGTAEP
jgi:nucleoside-diphosphate-sugar epimerase